jgi:acetylornithine/N-succinyldiaminopimelate aminotransferase
MLGQTFITINQRPELVFVRGLGSWLEDEQGKSYLDMVQGWAVNNLGHCPEVLTQALCAQARQLVNPSPAFYNRPALDLAQKLVEVSGFDRVFLASSGAEANEGAVKLARRWGAQTRGGAHAILGFDHGFHGRSLAMMSASGKAGWDAIYAPMPAGFPKARWNDIASVERALTSDVVAVMLELVQGEGGVHVADKGFVRELRALCTERTVLLMVDEVQTGVGRCGRLFAHQWFDVQPDVMTLAKGLGGGVPLSAVLCRERFNCFEPGDQGGTYCGNPVMAAAGLAVLNAIAQEPFLEQVRQRAQQLSAGLLDLSQRRGLQGERGLGLLRALVLPSDCADAVVVAARNLAPVGLLLNAPRPHLLRFMPALNISAAEMQQALALLDQALEQVLSAPTAH